MRIIKNIAYFTLSLVLVFNLILISIVFFIHFKLFNFTYYSSRLNSISFYENITQNCKLGINNLATLTNIPKEDFEPFYNKAWIKLQVDNYLKQFISYLNYKSDNLYKVNFDEPEKQLLSQGYLADGNEEQIKKEAEKLINQNIDFMNLQNIISIDEFQQLHRILNIINTSTFGYLGVMILLLGGLLIKYRKRFYEILNWYGYSFTAAGLMLLVMFYLPYKINFLINISIMEDNYLKNFVTAVVNDSYKFFIETGLLMTALGIIIIFASNFKYKSMVRNQFERM